MNPRQRRGVLLISLAGVCAVAVLVAVSGYLRDVRAQLGPMLTIVATAGDLQAYTPIQPEHLVTAQVPQRWAPPNTFHDPQELIGLVTAADVPEGTLMTSGLVRERPAVEPGQREIAILVDAETGVAGKLRTGDVVDIFATFPGDETAGTRPSSRIVVQRAQVLEVGSLVTEEDETFNVSTKVPITFLLSIADTRTLTYVESFATSIRLALRSPLDDSLLDDGQTIYQPGLDDLGRVGDPLPLPAPDATAADAASEPEASDDDATDDGAEADAADPDDDADDTDDGDADEDEEADA
ncbi:Flp pilus assembly protein CpaB [Egicoccus sp. AB-alg2]|uniref:Flp pilus assembly protein CpaB n=1 Tax=Egicoccus sp. AB-alg2 TaxID=3242693 RepID=UPI00359D5215